MASQDASIYQLKITLKDSKPPIWRRIQVNSKIKLEKLHKILQIVMGWSDYHLHQFSIDGIYYGPPDPEFDLEVKNERSVKLNSVITHVKQSFIYEYDFGDSWEHKIVLEKVLAPEPGIKYPICIDGKLACPPEDCGGIWGYYDLLDTLKNPDDSEFEEMLEWAGEDFDPDFFDPAALNKRLNMEI